MPGSGGKDSVWQAHILKTKYGMNPLTVTWAPHLYTDVGFKNFEGWLHKGGFDNFLFTPDGKVHRKLTQLAYRNLLHPFQPFIVGQRLIAPKMATKFKIPLIFYGETGAEYGNNVKENKIPIMNEKYFTNQNGNIFLGGSNLKKIIKDTNFKKSDFNPYLPIQKKDTKNFKFEVHHMNYYLKWDPQENFYYANKYCNFETNSTRTSGT